MVPADCALRTEAADDRHEVEALYDRVFGPTRRDLSSYQLRNGVDPVAGLGFVLCDGCGQLVGAIRFWPVWIGEGTERWPSLLVGPVGVHPTRQGEGFGGLLIRHGVAIAAETPLPATARSNACWSRALLIGDAPYYGRFGFGKDLARGIRFPPPTDPERVLARELRPGSMTGVAGPVLPWNTAAKADG